MKIARITLSLVLFGLISVSAALGHDPRTASKDYSHSLSIEGVGKLTFNYKSLHWNEAGYTAARSNEQMRNRLNNTLWKRIGKVDVDFDTTMGGVKVPKGSYNLGINFDGTDNFKLVLGGSGGDIMVPLKTSADGPNVTHLTFDIRPTDDPDVFLIEGRSGKFRCLTDLKVSHEH